MAKLFYLDEYLETTDFIIDRKVQNKTNSIGNLENFKKLCEEVNRYFKLDWEKEEGKSNEASDQLLMLQKKAIIGYQTEINYFRTKIQDYLKQNKLLYEWYPSWYPNLITAIFHENWGLAGIYDWKYNHVESSSAKIIGERIYYLINGELVLQEQTISLDRFKQLRKALLLRTPEKRTDNNYIEVYMLDGTRITIFDEGLAKQPTIVFRKYIVKEFTFEEQAKRGTIPKEIIPMFKAMIKVGYNVCFVGPVRTGKTTFLMIWQKYENPKLEGISIETDPEIPFHLLMPKSPIIQVVADGDKLKKIMKKILRSDYDYILPCEARDGVALDIAVEATGKGTRRVKSTFHTTYPKNFCYDAAVKITREFGGDLFATMAQVAMGYNYLIELKQLKNKSEKRLGGIYEIRYNPENFDITVHQICKYNDRDDTWTFKYDIGQDKRIIGETEDRKAFAVFQNELKKLSKKYPMEEDNVYKTIYSKLMGVN